MIDVCQLGTAGTMPLPDRALSALLFRVDSELYLVDCGEGTQVAMRKLGWGFRAVGTIFITHLHGDHVGGLPGLLLSLGNSFRDQPVDIYGPPGLRRVVRGLRTIAPILPYRVRIHEIPAPATFPVGPLTVTTLPLEHSLPCIGYRFDVPRARPFNPEQARALEIPVPRWNDLQHGRQIRLRGRTIQPNDVLGPARPGIALAFITDTNPIDEIVEFVRDVDLLVCEANYAEEEDRPKARERGHMLFSEAASLAYRARARKLWLTHYSASIADPTVHLSMARAIFPVVELGEERKTLTLRFRDDGDPL
ncbi:MAG: ribonuclease Z [Chloroflexota bacterium]